MQTSPDSHILQELAPQSRFRSVEALSLHGSTLLGDLDPRGKRILEIGCGGGHLSLWLASRGAREVLGLEPLLDGSNVRSIPSLERLSAGNEVPNLRIIREPFHEGIAAEGPFDVILGVNLINHLHETELDLRRDAGARREYLRLFRAMRDRLSPGGVGIFSDCSSRNAWTWTRAVGLHHPFSPTIDWKKHQPPAVWGELFLEAGFSGWSADWVLPRRLGLSRRVRPGRARALLSWLWTSYFVLRVRR